MVAIQLDRHLPIPFHFALHRAKRGHTPGLANPSQSQKMIVLICLSRVKFQIVGMVSLHSLVVLNPIKFISMHVI